MPLPERARRAAELASSVALLAAVVALWAMLVASSGPASSPMRFVPDPLPTPASPRSLPAAPASGLRVRLGFVGDIMQHPGQSGDDFAASYAEVAPLIRGFDLAMGNLEFPVDTTRPVSSDESGTRFNGSPSHLAALAGAGFDLLGTANNHAYDQGLSGLLRTVEAIRQHGLVPVGTAPLRRSLEQDPVVVDVGGVRVGVVAYTIPPNVNADESGKPDWPRPDVPLFILNFSDWTGEYREQGLMGFREQLVRTRAAGADFVVAFVHWGREWHFRPSEDQRRAAHDLIDAGFDLVVGAHSHVLSAPELYRDRLIAYSLGNFISDFRPLETRLGAVLELDVVRPAGGKARTAGFTFYPIVVEGPHHVVRPLRDGEGGEGAEALRSARRLLGEGVVSPH
jgi:poly-gamma-glutamate capsule biosynthesis protein CapA/YwtB (metallophosphatase superfamily)